MEPVRRLMLSPIRSRPLFARLGQTRTLVLVVFVAGVLLGAMVALGLPWPLVVVAFALGVTEIGMSLHLAHRQIPGLVRHTDDARAAYPEEFAAVEEVLGDMSHRAGLTTTQLLVAANRQIDYFTILGRHLVVTIGLLQSISLGQQHRRDGEAMIAHELGHVSSRRIGPLSIAYASTRALRYGAVGLVLVNLPDILSFATPGLSPAAGIPFVVSLALLALAHPVGASLVGLLDVAGEFDADAYATRLLGDPAQLATSLAATEVRNIARTMSGGATWAGARDIISVLHSLAPVYPQARIDGETLGEAAAMMKQALQEQGPKTPAERLDDGFSRLRRTWLTGIVRSHPATGERVRVLCGSLGVVSDG